MAPGASFNCEASWPQATLAAPDCQFLVYAQFGGQTTALTLYTDAGSTPLAWESIAALEKNVQVTWLSQQRRRYAVDFTPELIAVPFTCIASNLPATPPRNVFIDSTRFSKGFYRFREQR